MLYSDEGKLVKQNGKQKRLDGCYLVPGIGSLPANETDVVVLKECCDGWYLPFVNEMPVHYRLDLDRMAEMESAGIITEL